MRGFKIGETHVIGYGIDHSVVWNGYEAIAPDKEIYWISVSESFSNFITHPSLESMISFHIQRREVDMIMIDLGSWVSYPMYPKAIEADEKAKLITVKAMEFINEHRGDNTEAQSERL